MKKMTTIRINPEILKRAQELGLNISQCVENALKLYITALENANQKIASNQTAISEKGGFGTVGSEKMVDRAGFEPATSRVQVEWDSFETWLRQRISGNYARDLLNYARVYCSLLESGDLSEVAKLSEGKRRMVLAALGNLAKFIGRYDEWRQMIKRFGIKWSSVETKDQRVIERITCKADPEAVYGWVRQAKRNAPAYADFLDFIALTGLRLNEAIESWNLIHSLENLYDYYNVEKECLEHYRFKEQFLRRGKKAFISFVPHDLVERIKRSNLVLGSRHTIAQHIRKARFSDLREAWASIMTKHLSQAEIDFLQGRVGTSVFMQNYFNPALISDLKDRIFKAIAEIQAKIS